MSTRRVCSGCRAGKQVAKQGSGLRAPSTLLERDVAALQAAEAVQGL